PQQLGLLGAQIVGGVAGAGIGTVFARLLQRLIVSTGGTFMVTYVDHRGAETTEELTAKELAARLKRADSLELDLRNLREAGNEMKNTLRLRADYIDAAKAAFVNIGMEDTSLKALRNLAEQDFGGVSLIGLIQQGPEL